MNLKKYVTATVAVCISVCAFALPAPQDQDPVTPLLQQYAAQMQELQKSFDQKLFPVLKNLAVFALQVQASGQTDLDPDQTDLLEKHILALDKALTDLVAPTLKDLNIDQFNEQYAQMAKTYGAPAHQFTLQEVTDLFKGMYLVSALGYFEQKQKLNTDELTVLMEIFFAQDEEDESAN